MFERGRYFCRGCKKKNINNPTKLHCSDLCRERDLKKRKAKAEIASREPPLIAERIKIKGQNKTSLKRTIKSLRKEILRLQKKRRIIKMRSAPGADLNKKSDSFFESREWKELRIRAIVRYGRRCMACGAINTELHVDHIKPRLKYPELALCFDNLQILCRDCNLGKSWKLETDFRTPESLNP